ncbi:choline-binding protein A, partial [Bacillus pseudomycoides]
SGAMQTGWQQINGAWYYFNSSGAMQTGWQQINGKWYYFNSDGSWDSSK